MCIHMMCDCQHTTERNRQQRIKKERQDEYRDTKDVVEYRMQHRMTDKVN